ncbi:uncharacterized protein LOC125654923 isoform X1 [Ostrea edulis]|uniref:uncharacterized protein LOC125654923 isoform X1 n=1 Tax=Ostrea edulis TaxID=37623 RepID=UPI0024AE99BF|nr:uncharacterized protein LOC125654923 isoform X1 [Ostrea edulis]
MKAITLNIRCFLYLILCILSKADIISKSFTMEPSLHNKVSNSNLISKHHSESIPECSAICGELCACFGFNPKLKKCHIHQSCNPADITKDETGWRYFSLDVTNLALGKAVFASSYLLNNTKGLQNVVDGRTRVTDFNLLFHTGFELYPWLTVILGGQSIVKSITLYNRNDRDGEWLHDVETRVGNSTDWTQMSTCGMFVGPSVTGGVHVIECEKLLYGMFVTVKIVTPNNITVNGTNWLVLEEVVIAGIVV